MKLRKTKIFKIISAIVAVLAIGIIIFLAFSRDNFAQKANISADLPDSINVNQTLTLPITINTAGATINTAEVYLTFDPKALKVESVSKDNSIFKLWVADEPKFSNEKGEISFAGGLPTPGFKGRGQIGSVKLTPLKAGRTEINFDSKTRALLNDGIGTEIKLKLDPIKIKSQG